MSSVYSTSFIRSHGGAGGSYTVPDGYLAVIRNITAVNTSIILPEGFTVYLGHSSCSIAKALLSNLAPSGVSNFLTAEFRVVVEATDTMNVENDADVDVTVNGYLLQLP